MQSSSVFAGEVWGTDHARHVDTTIQDLAVSAQASSVNTVSITINDQLTAGDQIDIASYTLGSSGTNISIWTLKNGSPDENLGFVSLSSPSGAVTITLSKPVTNAQTIVAAVHDGNATRTDNILASDSATIIFDGVVVIGNQPAKDTDGDGQLEDVDGDGKLP